MSSDKFHLVRPSPWPIFTSSAACGLVIALALYMHSTAYSGIAFFSFLILLLLCMFCWWKDIIIEAITENAHSNIVKTGLRIGMVVFILSEVMFFFAFFWSFFTSWLSPAYVLEDLWPVKLLNWPPEGIQTLDPWSIPFLNTLILLLSGTTVTWAHYSLLNNDNKNVIKALIITVLLGLCFTSLQAYEYYHASFLFHEEGYKSIYSSNFYLATGFHGLHVIIGTIFLATCLVRAMKKQLTHKDHLGFEFAAWYWHFVDVVWLFLFTFLYWLSAA
jgi:cytochrome c oxidase subunit 3